MAACSMQTAVLENDLLPVVLQSILGEICSKALLTLVQSAFVVKGCCGTSTITCMTDFLHHGESRSNDLNFISIQPCATGSTSSDIDEGNASEKCAVSILDPIPAPEVAGRVSRHHFSEWLLVAKNKDDEDEDDDDDEDEEGDEDKDEGDDEDEDDDEGGDAEGGEGEGDDDDDEDEADDDEDEDDEDEDEDDDDEDESPPKKLRK